MGFFLLGKNERKKERDGDTHGGCGGRACGLVMFTTSHYFFFFFKEKREKKKQGNFVFSISCQMCMCVVVVGSGNELRV